GGAAAGCRSRLPAAGGGRGGASVVRPVRDDPRPTPDRGGGPRCVRAVHGERIQRAQVPERAGDREDPERADPRRGGPHGGRVGARAGAVHRPAGGGDARDLMVISAGSPGAEPITCTVSPVRISSETEGAATTTGHRTE